MSVPAPNANAPETPRKRGGRDFIDDSVQELRDIGLIIAPRTITYSPTQHSDSPGDKLYNNIKFLSWKDPNALHAVIDECKSDFAGPLYDPPLSAERRTHYVSKKVADAVWIVRNSYHQSPDRLNQPSFARTPPRSRHQLRSLQNIDQTVDEQLLSTHSFAHTPPRTRHQLRSLQKIDRTADEQLPTTPTSPLAKRSMANTKQVTSATTRDSSHSGGEPLFSDNTPAVTSITSSTSTNNGGEAFGSSWPASQDPPTAMRLARANAHFPQSITPTFDARPEQASNKRKRTDESEDRVEAPTNETRNQPLVDDPSSVSRLKNQSWQLRCLVKHGLGKDPETDHARYWEDILTDERFTTSTCVLSGVITWNSTSQGPLMKTKMNPVRWEKMSSRVQRHFGSHSFLTLAAPSFTKNLPGQITGKGQEEHRRAAFTEWLNTPKNFLGREWVIFHVEDIDDDKAKKNAKVKTLVKRISLFATKGVGIPQEVSLPEPLDWMLSFEANLHQPIPKLLTRTTLNTKQSKATFSFDPSQIRVVDDIRANGEPEDETFNNPAFTGKRQKHWDPNEVMTDGCASMSVGAALRILECLGTSDQPSAFQGRLNGSKGMWTVSAPYNTDDPEHQAIWIEIRPSQIKVKPREEDWDGLRCEEGRWTFDVKSYTTPRQVSHLHRDFLPPLEERHVPREGLFDIIKEGINTQIVELKGMLHDPQELVRWRHKHFPHQYQAIETPGLPWEPSQKVSLFVERAGYMPSNNLVVAEAMKCLIESLIQRSRSGLKFEVPGSSMFTGVIDPKGVLKPGEIHISLSEASKERLPEFHGKNVLMARDPTERGSDIQKVRCVYKEELAHLKDVAVFPTRGTIPLAAKLQGGDYDGDTFWVCSEERIVAPFLNAPVLEQKTVNFFGIKQEKRTVGDIIPPEGCGTEEHAKAFLEIALLSAFQDNQLGLVTNYCKKLSYARHLGKGLWDDDVAMVIDLHDHIIDAPKQGYMFGEKEFKEFRKAHRLPHLEEPSYRQNIEEGELRKEPRYPTNTTNGELRKKKPLLEVLADVPEHKLTHIHDCVLFELVNPPFRAFLEEFQRDVVTAAEKEWTDSDLDFCLGVIEANANLKRFINSDAEKQALVQPLRDTLEKWNSAWDSERKCNEDALLQCIEYYNSIKPANPENPYWSMPPVASSLPSNWDCYKLAVFARKHYGLKKHAIFTIARDVVCKMKSQSSSGREVLEAIRGILKPTKPKARADAIDVLPTTSSGEAEFDFEDGLDDDLFDQYDVVG